MAEDGRKKNGGNSTKSKKANDKRKNQNRLLLDQYINEDFDYGKLKALLNKLYKDAIVGDTKSATLFLSYALGKPKEFKEVEIVDGTFNVTVK